MPGIVIQPLTGAEPLAAPWQALEQRAGGSFFQSWTWAGCCAAERFAGGAVLRAGADGLALLGQTRTWRGRQFWLGESGNPAWDAVFVEHNGPLLARPELLGECLRALLKAAPRLRLSGVDAAHLAAAQAAGVVRVLDRQPAPFIDLAALGPAPESYFASLSANTRAQIRRSDRAYAALGPLTLRRAESLDEALAFLDALAVLHQATWTARGKPGAFANPRFTAFHRALLARALPRGESDLLRIAAGPATIGYLYNFRYRGRVLAYQSGFDYAAAPPHGKPGLTCHHAAIARARQDGLLAYDFLAGGSRYKTSLANASVTLHWLEVARRGSLAAAGMLLRRRLAAGAAA